MSLVDAYALGLLIIFVVSFSVGSGWTRQRVLAILIIILWLATLAVQVWIPGYITPWMFAFLQFPIAVIMFKTAQGNKWHLAVASWFIPMMLGHIGFSLVELVSWVQGKELIPFEYRYKYYIALNGFSFAQLATFGLWLVLDYGYYITDAIYHYFGRRSDAHVLQRKQK